MNLLSNALKYTLRGTITVRIGPTDDGAAALLQVTDTGCGVAPSELPRLFERFYRAPSSRGRNYEGTGIGLALVSELVKLHGGHLDATSVVGQGSTFSVSVPFGRSHLPHEHVVDDPAAARASAGPADIAFVLQESKQWAQDADAAADEARGGRPRILVVDDNADMRRVRAAPPGLAAAD
jgi:hypothetical protein